MTSLSAARNNFPERYANLPRTSRFEHDVRFFLRKIKSPARRTIGGLNWIGYAAARLKLYPGGGPAVATAVRVSRGPLPPGIKFFLAAARRFFFALTFAPSTLRKESPALEGLVWCPNRLSGGGNGFSRQDCITLSERERERVVKGGYSIMKIKRSTPFHTASFTDSSVKLATGELQSVPLPVDESLNREKVI